MAISELEEIRLALKEKARQNKLKTRNILGYKDLTPYNALERKLNNKNIIFK